VDHAVGTWRSLLDAHPAALVLALDAAARRVLLPDDPRFATRTALPMDDATGVDYVVPDDRLEVVRIWEQALAAGVGVGRVRLACLPERTMDYTLVACPEHEVWIGLLTIADDHAETPAGAEDPPGPYATGIAPSRPRTAIMHKNLYGVITATDERTTRMLGFTAEQLVGHRSLEFVDPDDHERAVGQWLEMRARRRSQRVRVRHLRSDGSWVWVEVENVFVGMAEPDRLVAVTHLTDISDEMAAHEALRRQVRLFRGLAESLPVGVLQLDRELRVVYANAKVGQLLGVHGAATLAEQLAAVAPGSADAVERAVTRALRHGTGTQVEVAVQGDRAFGVRGRALFTVAALADADDDPGAVVSVTDVTEAARLRDALHHQATHDSLTGVLNRAAVLDSLDSALRGAGAEQLAILFLDLDGFKVVNDSHGHLVGDQILVRIAGRLTTQAREGDLVGRLGGDEFLLVWPGVADIGTAHALAERVRAHVGAVLEVGGRAIQVTASVGAALARPGVSAETLVAEADRAMYRAKSRTDETFRR
jgi:diguanylate cyclase (GGDEF)-like protein/PAS domain S-box-containing protein